MNAVVSQRSRDAAHIAWFAVVVMVDTLLIGNGSLWQLGAIAWAMPFTALGLQWLTLAVLPDSARHEALRRFLAALAWVVALIPIGAFLVVTQLAPAIGRAA